MWNTPTPKDLSKLPGFGEQEKTPMRNQLIHMHFFIGGSDWWITEFDGEDTFFGFCRLNGDDINSEWGYVSFTELKEINVNGIEVDRDMYWNPKPCSEIEAIKTYDHVI
jgi:hypothetical protein